MDTLHHPHPASGFTAEAMAARPQTPPYTPRHHHHQANKANKGKHRLERSDSPASSIHPTETSSPAKTAAAAAAAAGPADDGVKVEELSEGDVGNTTDADVVYPEELEEVASSDGDDELSSSDGEGAHSDTGGISRRMSRLACGDENAEANFEKGRRLRRMSKRLSSRTYKRTHSQSAKGDSEEITDLDAMDDQDLTSTQRRLRRKVRGPPLEKDVVFEDLPVSDAEAEEEETADAGPSVTLWTAGPATPPESARARATVSALGSDAMDVEEVR